MSEQPSTNVTAIAESLSPISSGDAYRITFTPERQSTRRIRYEPRSDADGWWRIEAEWTGCTWRIVGREPVIDVVVERRVDDD